MFPSQATNDFAHVSAQVRHRAKNPRSNGSANRISIPKWKLVQQVSADHFLVSNMQLGFVTVNFARFRALPDTNSSNVIVPLSWAQCMRIADTAPLPRHLAINEKCVESWCMCSLCTTKSSQQFHMADRCWIHIALEEHRHGCCELEVIPSTSTTPVTIHKKHTQASFYTEVYPVASDEFVMGHVIRHCM